MAKRVWNIEGYHIPEEQVLDCVSRGLSRATVCARMKRGGMSLKRALSQPLQLKGSKNWVIGGEVLTDLQMEKALKNNLTKANVYKRWYKGFSIDQAVRMRKKAWNKKVQ